MKFASALFAALAVMWVIPAQAEPAFAWQCKPTGKNSKQCVIKNTGTSPGSICMTVVDVCKDGDHYADLCSGPMAPGDVTSRVVHDFKPFIRLLEKCEGTEFHEKRIEPTNQR